MDVSSRRRIGAAAHPAPSSGSVDSGLAGLRAITVNHRTVGIGGLAEHSLDAEAAGALHARLDQRRHRVVRAGHLQPHRGLLALARRPATTTRVTRSFSRGAPPDRAPMHRRSLCGERRGDASVPRVLRPRVAGARRSRDSRPGAGRARRAPPAPARSSRRVQRGAADRRPSRGRDGASASARCRWRQRRCSWSRRAVPLPDEPRRWSIGAGDTGVEGRRASCGRSASARSSSPTAPATAPTRSRDRRPATAPASTALPTELAAADAVFCAAGRARARRDAAPPSTAAAAARRGRPLVVVDLRDAAGRRARRRGGRRPASTWRRLEQPWPASSIAARREIPKAEAVIERELHWLHAWARHQALRPLVSDLRRKVEAIRRAELARAARSWPRATAIRRGARSVEPAPARSDAGDSARAAEAGDLRSSGTRTALAAGRSSPSCSPTARPTPMTRVRIGTRGSALARWQSALRRGAAGRARARARDRARRDHLHRRPGHRPAARRRSRAPGSSPRRIERALARRRRGRRRAQLQGPAGRAATPGSSSPPCRRARRSRTCCAPATA